MYREIDTSNLERFAGILNNEFTSEASNDKKITFGMVFGHIFYILFRLWLAAYISVMFYGFIKVMFTELPSEAHAVMIVFLLPIPVFSYCFLMWVLVVETLRMAFKIEPLPEAIPVPPPRRIK